MADIKGPNQRNSRDGDIVTPVVPANAFSNTRDQERKPVDGAMSLFAWSMMTDPADNQFNQVDFLRSFGLYIPENQVIQNNASTTIDGQTINAGNFYSNSNGIPSTSGDNFSSVFRGPSIAPNINANDFFGRTPRGSNTAIDGSFQQSFGIVVASEGGFSNHKADRGGATIFGIASASNPNEYNQIMGHLRSGNRDAAMNLTMQVYKEKYWDAAGIGNIRDADARLVAFDAAINHGAGYARRMIRNTGEDADAMLRYRANTYIQIVENNPSQRVFLNGWRNRLSHLNDLTHGDAAPNVRVASTAEASSRNEPRAETRAAPSSPQHERREIASTPVLSRVFDTANANRDPIRVPEIAARALDQAVEVAVDMRRGLNRFMERHFDIN